MSILRNTRVLFYKNENKIGVEHHKRYWYEKKSDDMADSLSHLKENGPTKTKIEL